MLGGEAKGPGRVGGYVQQPAGYRAFLPAPLPPNPRLRMNDLQTLLAEASPVLGRLDGSVLILPDPDLFVFMCVRKEAVLSSQVEGTQSSLLDLLEAEARIFSPDHPADVHEVINYVRACSRASVGTTSHPASCAGVRTGSGRAATP